MKSKKSNIVPQWAAWKKRSQERKTLQQPQRDLIQKLHDEVEAERSAFYARAQWQDMVNEWTEKHWGVVEQEIWEIATDRKIGGGFSRDKSLIPENHPLLTGFEAMGILIQSAMMEEAADHLENVLDRIRDGLEAEMKRERITPEKQSAILILDNVYWELKHSFRSGVFTHRTVGGALAFGAGVMRLAMQEPNGEIAQALRDLTEAMRREHGQHAETLGRVESTQTAMLPHVEGVPKLVEDSKQTARQAMADFYRVIYAPDMTTKQRAIADAMREGKNVVREAARILQTDKAWKNKGVSLSTVCRELEKMDELFRKAGMPNPFEGRTKNNRARPVTETTYSERRVDPDDPNSNVDYVPNRPGGYGADETEDETP